MENVAYLILGAAVALGIVGYVWWGVRLGQKPPAYPERRTVIVNLASNGTQAIRGVLWETTPEHLVIKGAELLVEKMTPMRVEGEIVVYRDQVAWLQVLAP